MMHLPFGARSRRNVSSWEKLLKNSNVAMHQCGHHRSGCRSKNGFHVNDPNQVVVCVCVCVCVLVSVCVSVRERKRERRKSKRVCVCEREREREREREIP